MYLGYFLSFSRSLSLIPLTLLSEFLSYFHVAVAVFVADVIHVRVAHMSMSVGVVNCSPDNLSISGYTTEDMPTSPPAATNFL